MALSEADVDAIAQRVIEIGELKRDDDLKAWEAARVERQHRNLPARLDDVEDQLSIWRLVFFFLVLFDVGYALSSRRHE